MAMIRLIDLLKKVPLEVEERVKRTRDQVRPVLQETLRTECRLVMRTFDEAESGAQVPISVTPGYPVVLEGMIFPENFERLLLLGRYRTFLEQARFGAAGLMELRMELCRRPNSEDWIKASQTDLQATRNWADFLLKMLDHQDPLKAFFAFDEDILGVYSYDPRVTSEHIVNRATIQIYWGVVGLVAELMGCSVEDLATVVLVHELAHAYTQLGADIDGRRWASAHFSKAEKGLVEGLAQYYTERVLRRHERRFSGALNVFQTMLPRQPHAYRTHIPWLKNYSPEAVRRAMLEMRRGQEGKLGIFHARLEEAKRGLK